MREPGKASIGGRQEQRVVIEGREFVVGAIYAPAKPGKRTRRRLVGFEAGDGSWRGGLVLTVALGGGQRRDWPEKVCGAWWVRWAGEAVVIETVRKGDRQELYA
jgi:hypothetical protein